jgi:hypothetical protein
MMYSGDPFSQIRTVSPLTEYLFFFLSQPKTHPDGPPGTHVNRSLLKPTTAPSCELTMTYAALRSALLNWVSVTPRSEQE